MCCSQVTVACEQASGHIDLNLQISWKGFNQLSLDLAMASPIRVGSMSPKNRPKLGMFTSTRQTVAKRFNQLPKEEISISVIISAIIFEGKKLLTGTRCDQVHLSP